MAATARITTDETNIFPRELDRAYPLIVKAAGVRLWDSDGAEYLDAISGGAMVTSLGHGVEEIIAAAAAQAREVSYLYSQQFTSPAQEELATVLSELAPPGFTRVHFVTGGAEANETALRMARSYHVERGEPSRWRVISPAQSYHGPTMATLALTGRPGLWGPFGPYLSPHLHIPPASWRFDPSGEEALAALDRALEEAGPENVSAFYCEPISAAALPAYTPPERFWRGLDERRREHGFLICFDEIVTGMGRTGAWFAASELPIVPDVIATAKGLGAGYAAIGATLCAEHVYEAIAHGSRRLPLGHTWDGAPLPCAVGTHVIEILSRERLVTRVRERGPWLRRRLEAAIGELPMVREVRGHGYLLGVEYVDPRDGRSFLPPELGVAGRIDDAALEHELVILSTQPTGDGMAGDQSLFAPPFTSSDEELEAMVARFGEVVHEVARDVEAELAGLESPPQPVPAGDAQ